MDNRCKDRKTLKAYFQRGNVPTEEQFAQLIDSVPNIRDDGRAISASADGVRLFPADEGGAVAALYASDPKMSGASPLWRIALDGEDGLEIRDGQGIPVMTVDREKNVTVAGAVKADEFLSGKKRPEEKLRTEVLNVKANGYWQNLPVESEAGLATTGCRVYRISVCCVNSLTRKHSTCEAIASHASGYSMNIRSPRKHWWGWSGDVRIRWKRTGCKLCLQMKSKGMRSGVKTLYCRIETLWNL